MEKLGERVCVSVALLLVAFAASASAQERLSYFKKGGVLEFRPSGAAPIRSLSWKTGDFLVAEWMEDLLPLKYYGKFDGRTELDITTGRLQIREATAEDAGPYKLELNGVIQELPYVARIPDELPTPTLWVSPVSCEHRSQSCTITCEGDVSRAGDVTYTWKLWSEEWERREKEVLIHNNETTRKVKTLTCRMENLIGAKDSEPTKNPFHNEHPLPVGAIVGGLVLVLILVGLGAGGFHYYNKKRSSTNDLPPDAEPHKPEEGVGLTAHESNRGSDNGTPAAPNPLDKEPAAIDETTPAST